MRIALVTDTYLPEINGVTTVLARMRRGLVDRGHEVLVVAPDYPEPTADEPGIIRRPSMPCPGYANVRLSWPGLHAVAGGLTRFGPDLVHVITEGPLGSAGRRWARRHHVPFVTSFHTDFPRYAARYLGDWAVPMTRGYLRRFHAPAGHTQTPSEETRAELVTLGLPRAVVWGRGVDADLFTPARRSAERRAALGATGRQLVLHVGRLAVEKDIDTLVAAFRMAERRLGAEAVFCVAGDGPCAADMRSALPFARHLGFLPRGVLADLYADADLFVFPSPTETCGLVALEAMASGLPVIAADQGGVRENLRDGINGRLVTAGAPAAFADATVQLVRDADQRAAMGQAARAFAIARDWEHELDELVPLYAEALRQGSAAAASRELAPHPA